MAGATRGRWDGWRRVAAALAAGVAAACAAPGAPPHAVSTSHGIVRAEEADEAREVAALLEELAPRVATLLGDARARPPEVWVLETLRDSEGNRSPQAVSGFTRYRAREPVGIHLRGNEDPRWPLAHELVHALCGDTWDALPGVLHEGLADVVVEELVPDVADEVRATRVLNAGLFLGGLDLRVRWTARVDRREGSVDVRRERIARVPFSERSRQDEAVSILALDRWALHEETAVVPEALYGLGWLVARRVVDDRGLDGLLDLCLDAQVRGAPLVPPGELLVAAGLDGTPWRQVLARELGRGEALAIARLLPDFFPDVAAGLFGDRTGRVDADRLFDELRPRLVLPDGEELPFSQLPGLRRELEQREGR